MPRKLVSTVIIKVKRENPKAFPFINTIPNQHTRQDFVLFPYTPHNSIYLQKIASL